MLHQRNSSKSHLDKDFRYFWCSMILEYSTLLVSIYGEWSESREAVWVSIEGQRKESLRWSLVNLHYFCFAQMKQNTIGWKTGMHHQLILIGGIHGWPVINACCTMPMEIGNIYYDYSFLWWGTKSLSSSVISERFKRTVWLYFSPFSLDLNSAPHTQCSV